MTINISDVVVNIGQQTSFNWQQLLIALVGAGATLIAAWGGSYWAAKMTDQRKVKDETQQQINKTLYLHSFVERYLNTLLNFQKSLILPKIEYLNTLNMEKIFERQPYVSYKINIKIEDYSYLINKNKDLWSILYEILHFSESFDSTLKEHDFLIQTLQIPVEMINIQKLQNNIETLSTTCNNLVFFLLLLYRNLHILLENVYKQEFSCADNLMIMSNFDLSKLDENEKGWVEGLKNSWK